MPRKIERPINAFNSAIYGTRMAAREKARREIGKMLDVHPDMVYPVVGTTDAIGRMLLASKIIHPVGPGMVKSSEYWRAVKATRDARGIFVHQTAKPQDPADPERLAREMGTVNSPFYYASSPGNPHRNFAQVTRSIRAAQKGVIMLIDITLPAYAKTKKGGEVQDPTPYIKKWLAAAETAGVHLAIVDSMSKKHGLADKPFGWLVTNSPALHEVLRPVDMTYPAATHIKNSLKILRGDTRLANPRIMQNTLENEDQLTRRAAKVGIIHVPGQVITPYTLEMYPVEKEADLRERLEKENIQVGWHNLIPGLPPGMLRLEIAHTPVKEISRILDVMQDVIRGKGRPR